MLLFSCNVTKNIGNDQKLLAKNKIELNKKTKRNKNLGFEKFDIEQIISPKPNSKILSFPVQLWIYQFYTPEQIEEKGKLIFKSCNKRKLLNISNLNSKLKTLEKKRDLNKSNSKKHIRYTKKIARKKRQIGKEEEKNCNKQHWSYKIGEAPIFSSLKYESDNQKRIRIFLKNKGYYFPLIKVQKTEFRNYFQQIFLPTPNLICENITLKSLNYFPGKVFFNTLCNISKVKKTKVKYIIETGKAYIIDTVKYKINNNELKEIVVSNKTRSMLKKGGRLDIQQIEAERKRISTYLRNSGYYTFSKDYIYFTIDTIRRNGFADITINISSVIDNNKEVIIKKHLIKDVYIYPNFKPTEALVNKEEYFLTQDTLIYYTKKNKKYNVIYKNTPRINKKAIVRGLEVASGDLYNLQKIKSSYKYLASLPIIQTANISFYSSLKDSLMSDTFEYINCEIRLTQDKLRAYELRGEATYTSGNWGVAGGVNYTHNNFFRRTEVLDLKFNFEFKRITNTPYTKIELSEEWFNSQKYGAAFNINFPRLFLPYFIKQFIIKSNPKSNLSGNYDFVNRPEYSWAIAGGAFGYNWNYTNNAKHFFTPLTVDYFNEIYNYIPAFINNRNYDDRFIIGGFYKFIFKNQFSRKQKKYFFITSYIKTAGNSLYWFNKQFNKNNKENEGYSVFGNTFAQFVKSYYDIRYYRKLNSQNDNIVLRIFTGAAFPYGNLNVIPFNEQFFSGGPNGLRAWNERTIGPGSYVHGDTNAPNIDIRADIKLEANIEYRKKFFNKLESAFFIDAGNIWAINNEDKREGALFEFNDFYKEIAIGTGFGLRWDLTMIILRADIGMKVRDPSLPLGYRWLSAKKFFSYKNMNVNIGIGYPF